MEADHRAGEGTGGEEGEVVRRLAMCPVCVANAAMTLAGVGASTGGLTLLSLG